MGVPLSNISRVDNGNYFGISGFKLAPRNKSWDYKTNLPQVGHSDPHHCAHGWNLCHGESAQQPPGDAPEVRVAA